jgi:putative transposase
MRATGRSIGAGWDTVISTKGATSRSRFVGDEHFYQVARYVERNALRANLVRRAEEWRFSSLWRRVSGNAASRRLLSDWPLPRPRSWVRYVNQPQSEAELGAIRRSVQRGQPFGGEAWVRSTAARLGLESTLRPRGRPKNAHPPEP